jgi:uncharacterized protein (DUF1697 family)
MGHAIRYGSGQVVHQAATRRGVEGSMALVVFLRGVNVGGFKTFRPSVLAQQLHRFDVVNVGAAGTFIVRKPVSQATLRGELRRLLPFDTEIMICKGSEVLRLAESSPLAGEPSGSLLVPFVSVLAKLRQPSSPLPLRLPAAGQWGLKIAGQQGRFVFGVYRREMRAIRHLAHLDRLYGVPATTRNWNTIVAIARILEAGHPRPASDDVSPTARRCLHPRPKHRRPPR